MVKGVATSIITVAVLMGSLVACGVPSEFNGAVGDGEGNARLWVAFHFSEKAEPFWDERPFLGLWR